VLRHGIALFSDLTVSLLNKLVDRNKAFEDGEHTVPGSSAVVREDKVSAPPKVSTHAFRFESKRRMLPEGGVKLFGDMRLLVPTSMSSHFPMLGSWPEHEPISAGLRSR